MSRVEQLRLDWSRPSRLDAAWDLLSDAQQHRLQQVWRKAERSERLRKAFGLPRHRYLSQGSIYAMSDWDRADAFCLCGYRYEGRICACGLWKFCPSCSHRRKWNAQCQFALHFRDTTWKFLTISFAGEIGTEDLDYCSLKDYWDATHVAMTMLQKKELFRGGIWREELQIKSFLPLRFRPHLHALCDTADLDAATVNSLMRSERFRLLWERTQRPLCYGDDEVDRLLRDGKLDALLSRLDVDCRETPTSRAFRNRLSYMQKEIKVLDPYRAAVRELGADADLTALNLGVERSLRLFSRATHHRKQSGAMGTLHPLSPNYIGTPRAWFIQTPGEPRRARERRESHRARIQRLLSGPERKSG